MADTTNPTISQISINGTTYDIRDATARDTYTEFFFHGYDRHSNSVPAGTLVYRVIVKIEKLANYCSRIFTVWKTEIAKNVTDARVEVRDAYLPSSGENTTMADLGFNQSFNTTGEYASLTGCDNLSLTNSRWTFYANAGTSYKVHYMGLNMYVFDCTKHDFFKVPCIISNTADDRYVMEVPVSNDTNQTGHGILTVSS